MARSVRQQELPPLRKLGCVDPSSGFLGVPSTADPDETQVVTLVAVKRLLDALNGALAEQFDELRAALPAAIAEAVWSHRSANEAQTETRPGGEDLGLRANVPQAVLPMNQQTNTFEDVPEAAQASKIHASQISEEASKNVDCNFQLRPPPSIPTEGEGSRQREWLSETNCALSYCRTIQREQGNFMQSAVAKGFVGKAGTIGGLKCHIADQLLRQHALLPQQGPSYSLSKVTDEDASNAPSLSTSPTGSQFGRTGALSLRRAVAISSQSPCISPTASQFGLTGVVSTLRRTPAVIGSRSSSNERRSGSQPAGAESASNDKQQESPRQTESNLSTTSKEVDDPVRSATLTPSIKTFVSRLDPRSVASSNQVEELRQRRVSELTSQMASGAGSFCSDDSGSQQFGETSSGILQRHATLVLPGRWLLLVFGVLPLRHFLTLPLRQSRWGYLASCYQPLVCLIVGMACFDVIACSLKLEVGNSSQRMEDGVQLGLFSDMALAIASLVGLLMMGAPMGSRTLCECFPLLFLTGDEASHLKLTKRMFRELVGLMLIWLAALLCRLYGSFLLSDDQQDSLSVPHYLSFVVISGVLISLALTMLSVCHSVAILVDKFCVNVSEILTSSGDLTVAVREWNVLQAVLRKASKTIEFCFFALQTGAFAAVILVFFDVTQGLVIQIIPGALVFLGLTRIFYCAAAITDKCADVPSLINSLHFGEDLDIHRQYVVQYIMQSAAGFYVFGVPLNSAVTLKLAYFCGVCTLGLMHRVLSSEW